MIQRGPNQIRANPLVSDAGGQRTPCPRADVGTTFEHNLIEDSNTGRNQAATKVSEAGYCSITDTQVVAARYGRKDFCLGLGFRPGPFCSEHFPVFARLSDCFLSGRVSHAGQRGQERDETVQLGTGGLKIVVFEKVQTWTYGEKRRRWALASTVVRELRGLRRQNNTFASASHHRMIVRAALFVEPLNA